MHTVRDKLSKGVLKRMREKKYINDYKAVVQTDKKGRLKTNYEYAGEYFQTNNAKALSKLCRMLVIYIIVSLAACLGALLINSDTSHSPYVVLPSAIALFCQIMLIIKAVPFAKPLQKMTRMQKDALLSLKPLSVAVATATQAAVLARLVYIIAQGVSEIPEEILGGGLCVLAAALAYTAYRCCARITSGDSPKYKSQAILVTVLPMLSGQKAIDKTKADLKK